MGLLDGVRAAVSGKIEEAKQKRAFEADVMAKAEAARKKVYAEQAPVMAAKVERARLNQMANERIKGFSKEQQGGMGARMQASIFGSGMGGGHALGGAPKLTRGESVHVPNVGGVAREVGRQERRAPPIRRSAEPRMNDPRELGQWDPWGLKRRQQ